MIDWTRLQNLRTDIGEEDFADVAFLFVAELAEHLDRMISDPGSVSASDFHFLRGSAANLGFVELVAVCSAAEAACAAGTPPDVTGVKNVFDASLAAVAPKVPELAQVA